MDEIQDTIRQMRKQLDITIEGDLTDFLGVNIDRRPDGTIHLSQTKLIDQILHDVRMDGNNIKTRETPAASSKLLSRHPDSPDFDNSFHYRSVIGKINYLERGSRPEIGYAAHQCASHSKQFARGSVRITGFSARTMVRCNKHESLYADMSRHFDTNQD
jgi:hypothetical protein